MKKTILLFTLLLFFSFIINAQVIETIAGNGTNGFSGDYGDALNAEINAPRDVDIDSYGNVYFCTWDFRIRKVDTNGIITTIAGDGTSGHTGDDSYAVNAKIGFTNNIYIHNNEIYFPSFISSTVRKININGIISTVATASGPMDIAFDSNDNLYIAEQRFIKKVDPNGVITTIAGNGSNTNNGDGGLAINAGFSEIRYIHIDIHNNIFISAGDDIIRKIDSNGIITTICGIGTGAFSGDNGPATSAALHVPKNITSINNDLYIVDSLNKRIRKIDDNGIITTYANGNIGGNLDGEITNLRGLIYKNNEFYISHGNKVSKITESQLSTNDQSHNVINLYPNPISNSFEINITNNAEIIIYNTLGQSILFKKITPENNRINISNLNKGIYQVKIITKKGEFSKKIIKQ